MFDEPSSNRCQTGFRSKRCYREIRHIYLLFRKYLYNTKRATNVWWTFVKQVSNQNVLVKYNIFICCFVSTYIIPNVRRMFDWTIVKYTKRSNREIQHIYLLFRKYLYDTKRATNVLSNRWMFRKDLFVVSKILYNTKRATNVWWTFVKQVSNWLPIKTLLSWNTTYLFVVS